MVSRQELKNEVKRLHVEGRALLYFETFKKNNITIDQVKQLDCLKEFKELAQNKADLREEYQAWYFKSLRLVKQLAPNRLDEFQCLYMQKKEPKEYNFSTYSISDYMRGLSIKRGSETIVDSFAAFSSKFKVQLGIIKAIHSSFDSLIIDIEAIIQSSFFDSEIKIAEDFFKKKHLRASGAICGVVLEKHFTSVCKNHEIGFRKKNPTIADYNDALKKNNVMSTSQWRLVQRLGDIRNSCVHSKGEEPKIDEIEDLIRGCKKLISELY
ncbi:hypothetical protein SANA_23220 [Gottschalkiaceae bacterium SANA]|nr:hypothetical protein SANA_23220 [Gottschalkiaceae bacterium SANA]